MLGELVDCDLYNEDLNTRRVRTVPKIAFLAKETLWIFETLF